MNVTSYNVTDVAYHYIGLRALGASGVQADKQRQFEVIRRGVLKYVSDRALRLMLPEPRGTFESVPEKIVYELLHFEFARSGKGAYELTDRGRQVLALLEDKRFGELRQTMVEVHLRTYDNLAVVVRRLLEQGPVWRPIVEAQELGSDGYISGLLEPTFGSRAPRVEAGVDFGHKTPKQVEDAVGELILREAFPSLPIRIPLFRALVDRLASLRLVNVPRVRHGSADFAKTYSPSAASDPGDGWHREMRVVTEHHRWFTFFLSDPNMLEAPVQRALMNSLASGFRDLAAHAGYFDLPDVRDYVCERLMIPEAAFDEGINELLNKQPSPITVSLQYERITARRRPLVRTDANRQIFNLIRTA